MGILPGVLRLWNWVAYYFLPKNITKIDHLPLANRKKTPSYLYLPNRIDCLRKQVQVPTNETRSRDKDNFQSVSPTICTYYCGEGLLPANSAQRQQTKPATTDLAEKKNHFFSTDRSRAQLAEQEGPPAARFHSSCHSQCGGAAGLRAGGGGDCLLPNLPPMFVAKKTIAHHNAEFFLHTPLSVKMPERYRGAREIYW